MNEPQDTSEVAAPDGSTAETPRDESRGRRRRRRRSRQPREPQINRNQVIVLGVVFLVFAYLVMTPSARYGAARIARGAISSVGPLLRAEILALLVAGLILVYLMVPGVGDRALNLLGLRKASPRRHRTPRTRT